VWTGENVDATGGVRQQHESDVMSRPELYTSPPVVNTSCCTAEQEARSRSWPRKGDRGCRGPESAGGSRSGCERANTSERHETWDG